MQLLSVKKFLLFKKKKKFTSIFQQLQHYSKICISIPSNVYTNISKDKKLLCDSSTDIDSGPSRKVLFHNINATRWSNTFNHHCKYRYFISDALRSHRALFCTSIGHGHAPYPSLLIPVLFYLTKSATSLTNSASPPLYFVTLTRFNVKYMCPQRPQGAKTCFLGSIPLKI